MMQHIELGACMRLPIDYSQKKFWTVDLLEETLKIHTVLKPNEKGNYELLWQAKIDCEKTMGCVMRPAK
ncbi:hypothetical protein [Bacillus sp. FJAT-26390]|uniref:hypothetical protein n=1 Tax=Bacillus sp. FJAT-26390 TaxID=1743142 RepID=UPI00114718FF|nr:hypothetical protein [Bacillus sp. FJAT-26390]